MTNPRDRSLLELTSLVPKIVNRDGLELGAAKKQLETMSFELHPILDLGHAPRCGVWYAVSPETADSPGGCGDAHPPPPLPAQSLPKAVQLSSCGPGPRVGACASFLAGCVGGGLCGRVLLSAGATPEGPYSDLHELRISANSLHWLSLPSSGLPPRYEHAAFFTGEDLTVYGGAEERGPLGDIWKYNDGQWCPVLPHGNVPPPRTFHSSSSARGQTLVIFSGGSSGSNPVQDKKVYLFDAENFHSAVDSRTTGSYKAVDLKSRRGSLASSLWSSPHTNGQGPSPRQGHVTVTVGNKLFIHGGMAGQEIYGDLHVLDLDKLLWWQPVVSGPPPPPLAAHGCAVIKERLFLFGGLSPSGASDALFCLNTDHPQAPVSADHPQAPVSTQHPQSLVTGTMTWEDVEVSGPPSPARLDHAMCSILLPVPLDQPAESCAPTQGHSSDNCSSSHESQEKAVVTTAEKGEAGEGSPSARPHFSGDNQSENNPGCFHSNGGAAPVGLVSQETTHGETAVNTITVVSSDELSHQDVRVHSKPSIESSSGTKAVLGGKEDTASEHVADGVEEPNESDTGAGALERLCLTVGSHQPPDKWRLMPALFVFGGMDTAGHIHSDSFVFYPAT